MPQKPWDAQVARALITPFAETWLHPNHVTTLGVGTGLAAAYCYALGGADANLGGILFVLTGVIDHADGELARMTGKTSEFGHTYDRIADLVVKTSLFVGMGIGLRDGSLGAAAVPMGFVSGLALGAIFTIRGARAKRKGHIAFAQPSYAGFELEDLLYLIAPVTWLGGLATFLSLAFVGIPAFAAWSAFLWWRDS
ncbi:MAG: CDP-alcohol phosphatidyltransferase family protein [Candidatus Binatia bacterium]|nr:CDP-alcohol phosphatidyltransferase family protein [Candidatus Binatia bacterium]